jgi:nucleoside-diphosphate-sugar epimerase
VKVLVTGGGGYLGSVLLPKLLTRGHQVQVVDIGYFGLGHLAAMRSGVQVLREDLRTIAGDPILCRKLLDGIDCVIHLAAISNDPSAELNPQLTQEVNFETTVKLAEAARELGIRFVFSSSCSVYGDAEGDLTEDAALNPLTVYAASKVQSEQALTNLASESWQPVILRNGTLFGFSPRMRFDLVVNIFALYGTLRNEIKVFGDGLQWRPFLSVHDCARAFVFFAEKQNLRHVFYNISHQNLRVVDVADVFLRMNPNLKVTQVQTQDPDRRNYRVSAARMLDEGFRTRTDVMEGAEGIAEAIATGAISDPESVFYRNAKWLKDLTTIGSMDHRQLVSLLENFSILGRGTSA